MNKVTPEEFETQIIDQGKDGAFILSQEACYACKHLIDQCQRNGVSISVIEVPRKNGALPFSLEGKVRSFPTLVLVCGGVVQEVLDKPSLDDAYDFAKRA